VTAATAELRAMGAGRDAWRRVVFIGLVGAAVAIYASLVGVVPIFHERPMIQNVISLGQTVLVLIVFGTGYIAARGWRAGTASLAAGALGGGLAGFGLTLLVLVGAVVDLRAVFAPASNALYDILTFELGTAGAWAPTVVGVGLGLVAGALALLPIQIFRLLTVGFVGLLLFGLFAGLLRTPMLGSPLAGLARLLFASNGLTTIGAVIIFALVTGGAFLRTAVGRMPRRAAKADARERTTPPPLVSIPLIVLAVIIALALPHTLGPFFAQVIALVAIYILMAFGLNITLGLAGLLDLGFVAFFAVGAYTVGLLTSSAEYGLLDWPFWAAVPFAVLAASLFGGFLGLPILGIRGDYLAIATLGFGEIIRVLAGSDLLKPVLGGPRGIINIARPFDFPNTHPLAGPNQIYYIALIFAGIAAFVAWRLRGSRLGRAWIAVREDEDVGEALGINLINTKLLAYMLGAAFAGLGGAVFAGLINSIFPSSINLYVSINVAAIIIIGGMGSLPGVVVGALFLIGIPELFREFAEYRFLFYGIALIAMMRFRPEGLIPSRTRALELHHVDADESAEPAIPPTSFAGKAVPPGEQTAPAEGPPQEHEPPQAREPHP
jgi:branched-chain amino acid transport system permease protein